MNPIFKRAGFSFVYIRSVSTLSNANLEMYMYTIQQASFLAM